MEENDHPLPAQRPDGSTRFCLCITYAEVCLPISTALSMATNNPLHLKNVLAACVIAENRQPKIGLVPCKLEAWHGVCGGSGVWAAKNPLLESLENNFMPCCRGLHLSSSQHKHPCYFAPAPRNQPKTQT